MRVEQDVKLTFDDVLIRPKRSTLISRSDVTLVRNFKFRHSDATWEGVPIVARIWILRAYSVLLKSYRIIEC